jgi:phosphohistidine phosphatase
MELFILRHGKAEQRSPTIKSDLRRKLTKEGEKEIEDVADALSSLKIKFNYIITSPLKRAKQTAEIVLKKCKETNSLVEWNELKPESKTNALYEKLSSLKINSTVLLVGHDPFLSSMIGEIITDGKNNCRVILKKGGLAKISLNSLKPKINGELQWLIGPKQIKKLL